MLVAPNRTGRWLAVLILISTLVVYVAAATRHAFEVNVDPDRTDQAAYVEYAKNMRISNYSYVGGRNRMPAYPFVQSLFYGDSLSDDGFFRRGKTVNIAISILGLFIVLLVTSRALGKLSAFTLTAVTAFSVWVYKAGYFQTELLFYLLIFLLYLVLARSLRAPSWSLMIGAGLLAAVAHLTKASVLPAVLVFVAIFAVSSVARSVGQATGMRRVGVERMSMLGLFLLIFLGTLSPYLSNSKQVFGRYFYNVNSTFYMWYDSWDEVMLGTRAHGDRVGWPQMKPEDIPGPTKYFREHTARDAAARLYNGARTLWRKAWSSYGYLKYVMLYGGLLLGLVLRYRRRILNAFLDRYGAAVLIFGVGYVALYLALYSWYTPIADGVRLPLALFLPVMFSFAHLLDTAERGAFHLNLGRHALTLRRFHWGVLILLLYDVYFVLPGQIWLYAGD